MIAKILTLALERQRHKNDLKQVKRRLRNCYSNFYKALHYKLNIFESKSASFLSTLLLWTPRQRAIPELPEIRYKNFQKPYPLTHLFFQTRHWSKEDVRIPFYIPLNILVKNFSQLYYLFPLSITQLYSLLGNRPFLSVDCQQLMSLFNLNISRSLWVDRE